MKTSVLIFIVFNVLLFLPSCQKSEIKDLNTNKLNTEKLKNEDALSRKKNLAVGDSYGGGIVFFIDETGKHGLIVASEDAGIGPWGCNGTFIPGTLIYFGTGQSNTNAIIKYCSDPGSAARLCDQWVNRDKEDKGKKYNDWFLPSMDEFTRIAEYPTMANFQDKINLIPNELYWTSTQGTRFMGDDIDGKIKAFLIKPFIDENDPTIYQEVIAAPKEVNARARPIRAF